MSKESFKFWGTMFVCVVALLLIMSLLVSLIPRKVQTVTGVKVLTKYGEIEKYVLQIDNETAQKIKAKDAELEKKNSELQGKDLRIHQYLMKLSGVCAEYGYGYDDDKDACLKYFYDNAGSGMGETSRSLGDLMKQGGLLCDETLKNATEKCVDDYKDCVIKCAGDCYNYECRMDGRDLRYLYDCKRNCEGKSMDCFTAAENLEKKNKELAEEMLKLNNQSQASLDSIAKINLSVKLTDTPRYIKAIATNLTSTNCSDYPDGDFIVGVVEITCYNKTMVARHEIPKLQTAVN